jgi:eukaryotic-like serine/threonine-protein kinase
VSARRGVFRAGREIAPGYTVLGLLNRGRTLDVFDAWSEERGTRCIAKTLRVRARGDASARRRLLREGRLLCRLTHPHIVRGYEVFDGDPPVVVMETLAGETLAHLIARRRRPLAASDLAHLGLQLAAAVGYLHLNGVLHLDLKPANVVVEAGRAKVIDLSVARPPGRGRPGIGTWCYSAPEQAAGGPLTPAADVWGIAITLYEAATGEHVFAEDDPREYPQLDGRIPPLGTSRRLPRALAEALNASLDPDADRRPSLRELVAAFANVAPDGAPPARRGRRG